MPTFLLDTYKGQVKGNDETAVTVSLKSGSNVDFYRPGSLSLLPQEGNHVVSERLRLILAMVSSSIIQVM